MPEEENRIASKTKMLKEEIVRNQKAWDETPYIGKKPNLIYGVVGFSSSLMVSNEEMPAVVMMALTKHFNEESFYVGVPETEHMRVYNTLSSDEREISKVIRRAKVSYGENAVYLVYCKRV